VGADGEVEQEPRSTGLPAKAAAQGAENLAVEEAAAATAAFPDERDREFPQIVRALRNKNFRLFWSGNFLSNIGTWMQNVAQGWLILTLTGSAFWLGVVGFAGSIPFLVFTLFGGVVADRVNKRRLLLVTQSIMMLLAFALAALAWFKIITVWEVVALAFLNGMAMAMNAPSYQALVPRLVPREDLTNALALNSAQFNMSRILGPTLGGYAMALVGVAGNFFLNGVSFLAVLWALTRIEYPEQEPSHYSGLFSSLRDGFSYVRANKQMRVLLWMTAAASFFGIPFITFIPYFARIVLQTDEAGLGWLMAASGTGAVLGAVTVAALGQVRHRGMVVTFGGVVFFSVIVCFCYSHSFVLSQCLLLVEGYSAILMISSFNVAIQHLASDHMRGRVMSIYATSFLGLPPLGSLLAGEMSRHIPTPHALAAMATVAAAIFLCTFFVSRPLRELD
jgi:MFS family permease